MAALSGVSYLSSFFGARTVTYIVFALVYYAFTVLVWWVFFKKIGEKPYKAFIPLYRDYLLFRYCGIGALGIIVAVASAAQLILTLIPADRIVITPVIAVLRALVFVFECILAVILCKKFGKGTGYIIGLIFLPNIFLLILGYEESKSEENTETQGHSPKE